MPQPLTTGPQIKIFVGTAATGSNAIEPMVNTWLAANPLIKVQNIDTTIAPNGSLIVTIWFEGSATG